MPNLLSTNVRSSEYSTVTVTITVTCISACRLQHKASTSTVTPYKIQKATHTTNKKSKMIPFLTASQCPTCFLQMYIVVSINSTVTVT